MCRFPCERLDGRQCACDASAGLVRRLGAAACRSSSAGRWTPWQPTWPPQPAWPWTSCPRLLRAAPATRQGLLQYSWQPSGPCWRPCCALPLIVQPFCLKPWACSARSIFLRLLVITATTYQMLLSELCSSCSHARELHGRATRLLRRMACTVDFLCSAVCPCSPSFSATGLQCMAPASNCNACPEHQAVISCRVCFRLHLRSSGSANKLCWPWKG